MKLSRRTFLSGVAVIPLVGIAGFYAALPSADNRQFNSLQEVVTFLSHASVESLNKLGEWNLAQTFIHLAQSIEFSVVGFPKVKPEWFQKSIGSLVFHLFSAKGTMKHGLSEPIPGAQDLDQNVDVIVATNRLIIAIDLFNSKKDTFNLQPHFAYGELSWHQYERAHLLHINDHFREIKS